MRYPKQKPGRSARYLAWLRTLPCSWCKSTIGVEASHHGLHGTATKASDYRAIPLCGSVPGRTDGCHAFYHRHGCLPESSMTGEQVRAWAADRALDLLEIWIVGLR